jgi:hypothetical protein
MTRYGFTAAAIIILAMSNTLVAQNYVNTNTPGLIIQARIRSRS